MGSDEVLRRHMIRPKLDIQSRRRYNALRLCGQTSLREARHLAAEKQVTLRKEVGRRRLRSVILDLMYQAARWVRHGPRFGLTFGCFNPWFDVWRRTYLRACI